MQRFQQLSCGIIAEIKKPTYRSEKWTCWFKSTFSEFVWKKANKVIYNIYFFSKPTERFCLKGILRTAPMAKTIKMDTITCSGKDIYGKFTRFDFDILTLSNYNNNIPIPFLIDNSSPSRDINSQFLELDLEGHQFPVCSNVSKNNDVYFVTIGAGIVNR